MRHHRKVVAVALQNFVVDTKACFAGRAVFLYFCHINALKRRKLIPPVTNYKNSHHLRYLSSPGDSSGNPDQCPLRSWSHISRLPVRWHRCRQTLSLRWLESRRVRREYVSIHGQVSTMDKKCLRSSILWPFQLRGEKLCFLTQQPWLPTVTHADCSFI